MKWFSAACCSLFLAGMLSVAVSAQNISSSLTGVVKDAQEAVLPGVTVTATSPALIGSQVQVTESNGSYRFASLPPGTYTLTFDLPGFQSFKRSNIVLALSQTLTIDASLQVAAVQETVQVTAASPVVDVSTTAVGNTLNSAKLLGVPSSSDLWGALAQAPGITMQGFDVGGGHKSQQTSYITFGVQNQNRVVTEGVDTTEGTGGAGFYQDFYAQNEIAVSGAGQDVQMNTPGAAVISQIKSGGNRFSGLAGEVAGLGSLLAVALLAPFDFGHIVEGTVANSEALYGLLVVVATWSAWRWLRDEAPHRLAWAGLTGAVAGAATLVRAEFLLAALLLAAYAAAKRARTTDVALSAAVFCIVLTPTTIWHWRSISAFDAAHVGRVAGPLPRFAPVTSYGPFNFAMANHENADGGPNRDHPMLDRCDEQSGARLEVGQLDLACPAIYDLYVNGYEIGGLWLLNNPSAALALLGRKAAYAAGFLAQGFLADDLGVGVDGVRRRVDLVDPATWWLIPIRLLLIVAGVLVLWRRPVALAVIAAPLAAFAASTLLFYGYVRLGTAYISIVYVLEAAGLARIAALLSRRPATYRTVYAVLAAIAILVGYQRSVRDVRREVPITGPHRPDGSLIQDETIEIRRP